MLKGSSACGDDALSPDVIIKSQLGPVSPIKVNCIIRVATHAVEVDNAMLYFVSRRFFDIKTHQIVCVFHC